MSDYDLHRIYRFSIALQGLDGQGRFGAELVGRGVYKLDFIEFNVQIIHSLAACINGRTTLQALRYSDK